MCDQGPALLVNDRVYTKVTPEQVHAIIDECKKTFGAHAALAKPFRPDELIATVARVLAAS